MDTLLKKLLTADNVNLDEFTNKDDLITTLKDEFINSKSMAITLAENNKLRKNLLNLFAQIYDYHYVKTLNDPSKMSNGVQMKKIFGSKSLKFFTTLRQKSDENLLYR